MRLWTLHPGYLDAKGLVACWREALLAQKVLSGNTHGYRNHSQLFRFRSSADPISAITTFLHEIAAEATRRGYQFDIRKIIGPGNTQKIIETRGQLDYEWAHLMRKLEVRAPTVAQKFHRVKKPQPHPLFQIIPGEIREWEKRPNQVQDKDPDHHPEEIISV